VSKVKNAPRVPESKVTVGFRASTQVNEFLSELAKKERRTSSSIASEIMEFARKEWLRLGVARTDDFLACHLVRDISHAHGTSVQTRISRETQEQLATALETILARAPSTVVAEIAERLLQWAGKYGDEE